MIKYGRYPDKVVADLATEAVIVALKDANMTMKDIQMVGSEIGRASCRERV